MIRAVVSVCGLLCLSGSAWAHKMHVDPRVKGDVLHVEAFFEDDTPAEQAKITVFQGDRIISEGRADDRGIWTCPRPGPGTYIVKAESLGHAARETLVIADESSPTPSVSATPSAEEPTSNSREDRRERKWYRAGLGFTSILLLTIFWKRMRRSRSAA